MSAAGHLRLFTFSLVLTILVPRLPAAEPASDLRVLAESAARVHRFSTLFTAQDVRRHLSTPEGLDRAVDWCHRTAVTKVYVETFRDGYQVDEAALSKARDHFRSSGLEASGCVTTTKVGKPSTGWDPISCYTDPGTRNRIREIFEFTAGLFDEIMIDDFWFTDCACQACDAARKARTVSFGDRSWPVNGEQWEDYRGELMVRLSQEEVLAVAKRRNPNVRLIIKYPQWYDQFHERGYDVARQTADFDLIWVGTETRDYNDARWGGTVQYEAYFIMRWLGGIGGPKCGGGWYDWLGTTERTYLEQARMTVLAGARESMLFCYGGLQDSTGPANVAALRKEIPELFATAREVASRQIVGVAAYKPVNSHPEGEPRVFDFVGMLGLPLVPCHEFPVDAKAAFFSLHALKDPDLAAKLTRFIRGGRPVLITDGLAARLKADAPLDAPNVQILELRREPKSLLTLSRERLDVLRAPLLEPSKMSFTAPNGVALCLFADGSWVVSNFNDREVVVRLQGQEHRIPARGWRQTWLGG